MTMDEFMETFNFGGFRRKSRKAMFVLKEVFKLTPNMPDAYRMFGLIHNALGNYEKACDFYFIAAFLSPKDQSLWKQLLVWSVEKGDTAQARFCLGKAITADPQNISLRFYFAFFYVELGDYERAAESYVQIHKLCPEDVEALKTGAKLYLKCGKIERSVGILEDYLKNHPSEADLSVIDQLVDILMNANAHDKALQHIELAHMVYCSGKEVPVNLKIKEGICHLRMGNVEQAEIIFGVLQRENACDHADLITEVADAFMSLEHYNSALKYYHILEANCGTDNGSLNLKIAECYLNSKERGQAIMFFHKVVCMLQDNVDARLTLASLLLEDGKEDEAITLPSPPKMLGIFPLVRESLSVEALRQKAKVKRRLSASVLMKKPKYLMLCKLIKYCVELDLSKAARDKKLFQKKGMLKEGKKALAMAAGIEWHSDDSESRMMSLRKKYSKSLPCLIF